MKKKLLVLGVTVTLIIGCAGMSRKTMDVNRPYALVKKSELIFMQKVVDDIVIYNMRVEAKTTDNVPYVIQNLMIVAPDDNGTLGVLWVIFIDTDTNKTVDIVYIAKGVFDPTTSGETLVINPVLLMEFPVNEDAQTDFTTLENTWNKRKKLSREELTAYVFSHFGS